MRRRIFLFVIYLSFSCLIDAQINDIKAIKNSYIQLSGELFRQVQLSGIFRDSKTFVDAVPLSHPDHIRKLYDSLNATTGFNLKQFVSANFSIPSDKKDTIRLPEGESMQKHIETLWQYLAREPEKESKYSTLITLKYAYVVPGGRFREIYYWDSFFTMLGLLAGGRNKEAEDMVQNFAYLIDSYGLIPNGNRIYYLTRSQPPFFSLMVDMICRTRNDYKWGLNFIDQLQKEYMFWMNGASGSQVSAGNAVRVNDNVLNRYYDSDTIPREESFREDYLQAEKIADSLRPEFCRNIRAAAESGWDFSSRWFSDEKSIKKIQTLEILPVDLNCLLYFLEDRLSLFYKLLGDNDKNKFYSIKAAQRRVQINRIFWNEKEGYYFDYNWKTKQLTKTYSLAACFPLYFGIASQAQAAGVARMLKEKFLMPGGLITTLSQTGQQWDAPNGWPPLQWIAIKGLREYGYDSLADEIKGRWIKLNEDVYKRTGRMLEKYNVENLELFAGGGEYPLQDGFGWTNGVAAALLKNFDKQYLFMK
ncbi:MAG: alpha,alpha-trehalase TreF [Ignavibacteriales bacterium]